MVVWTVLSSQNLGFDVMLIVQCEAARVRDQHRRDLGCCNTDIDAAAIRRANVGIQLYKFSEVQ
jgi:nicotinamidase-related amidase